jgi:hypothetical protein
MKRASRLLRVAAGAILACPWLACGELPQGAHLTTPGSLLFPAQFWPQRASTPISAGFDCTAFFAFSLALFLAMGYIWQALDEEEFPDRDLPPWFVWLFRGRRRADPSRRP